ncbi:MAG TPA: transmembrane anchor protein [Caulobacteraceae bacterium]|jgi:hypothetical protein
MHNAHKPDASELPSTGKLLRSTGLAALIAGALLVTVVLPAEYAVDPTGAGEILGLTEMGRVKRSLAAEAEQAGDEGTGAADAANLLPPEALAAAPAAPAATPLQPAPPGAAQTHETSITLAPDEAAEVKLVMRQGARAEYSWASSGGRVNFDVHGDGAGIKYHGYGKGSDVRAQGVLVAAFDGNHGWFWRNRSGAPVTITLKTSGAYSDIKRVV